MMQVTFILRHGSDRNHCLSHQSTVHTAAISKACGLLTEIIVCVFVCFVVVVFYQSTRQPYWKLVDCWQKSSCFCVFLFFCFVICLFFISQYGNHIESLWTADWNHRVFLWCFLFVCLFLSVNTAAILKACRFLTEIIMCSISQQSTLRPYRKLVRT